MPPNNKFRSPLLINVPNGNSVIFIIWMYSKSVRCFMQPFDRPNWSNINNLKIINNICKVIAISKLRKWFRNWLSHLLIYPLILMQSWTCDKGFTPMTTLIAIINSTIIYKKYRKSMLLNWIFKVSPIK